VLIYVNLFFENLPFRAFGHRHGSINPLTDAKYLFRRTVLHLRQF